MERLRITLDLRVGEERQVTLTVTDNGRGYPADADVRSTGGIAQSRELIANLHGTVEMGPLLQNSELPVGTGTVAVVTIPGSRD